MKNTKPMTVTDPKTGEKVTTVPDGKKADGQLVEVKDTKSASLTKQIRAENAASQATSGKPVNVVVGENTNVSKPLQNATEVTKIKPIGPQQ